MNRAITTALIGVGAAQLIKVPIAYVKTGRWDWSNALEAGGMPSSHSAGVAALSTYTAMKRGIASIDFAISAVYGLIVMYDAMGVRRHAGEIAIEVNDLDAQVEMLSNKHPGTYHKRRKKDLEERLGHIPIEVAAGTALGIAVGAASYYMQVKHGLQKLQDWLISAK